MAVLVLNATYEPLHVISLRRAVVLLLKEKAEVVEAAEAVLRSERLTLTVPLVIRLVYYVKIPRHLSPPMTRRTVLLRDRYTCQYCGSQPGKAELTMEHVVPRCRGGRTTWDNVVAACRHCNQRKGEHTPQEVGMALLSRPSRPQYGALVLFGQAREDQAWAKYLMT